MNFSGTSTFLLLLLASLFSISCAQKKPNQVDSIALTLMSLSTKPIYQTDIVQKEPDDVSKVQKVAFVSGMHQAQDQELWNQISVNKPDLVVVAGNTVSSSQYYDKLLGEQYKNLDQVQSYRRLRSQAPFMAVWDELDYGVRDGDSGFEAKNESRDAFVKYWSYIPKYQSKTARGVEHSVVLGSPGQRVQVIFLDTRYYVTPWLKTGTEGKFKKNWNRGDTLLGADQWKWLESELRKPAEYRVIVSPLQIAANSESERWGLFPAERQRFFDLLRVTKASKVLVVSGGRGFGSFARVDLDKGYGPLYDMTVGPVENLIKAREDDTHYFGKTVSEPNFGLIEWDWNRKKVKLKLINEKNAVVESMTLSI